MSARAVLSLALSALALGMAMLSALMCGSLLWIRHGPAEFGFWMLSAVFFGVLVMRDVWNGLPHRFNADRGTS